MAVNGPDAAIKAIGGQAELDRMAAEHDLDYLGEAIRRCLGSGSGYATAVAAARVAWHVRRELLELGWEPVIDPDCKAGKCRSCAGPPCGHSCHAGGTP